MSYVIYTQANFKEITAALRFTALQQFRKDLQTT